MGDGSLSQEEIDALLMGTGDSGGGGADPLAGLGGGGSAPASGGGGGSGLSPSQKDALNENFNEAMQIAGNAAGSVLGKSVSISVAGVEEVPSANIAQEVVPGSALVSLNMGSHPSYLVIPADLAMSMAASMMGSETPPPELDEAHASTLGELANTIISSLSNHLSGKFDDSLAPGPPDVKVIQAATDVPAFPEDAVKLIYNVTVEGVPPGKISHYVPASAASNWAQKALGGGSAPAMGFDMGTDEPAAMGGMDLGGGDVNVAPVNFPSLQPQGVPTQVPPNLDLLLDVKMTMTVELGRTTKYVKDILTLGEGSIIELDKLAGEPVDLLINGKLIAKGEVVVIDENFGVRVTDIVGPAERLAKMSGG